MDVSKAEKLTDGRVRLCAGIFVRSPLTSFRLLLCNASIRQGSASHFEILSSVDDLTVDYISHARWTHVIESLTPDSCMPSQSLTDPRRGANY